MTFKTNYATAKRDGYEVPLIGVPKTAEPTDDLPELHNGHNAKYQPIPIPEPLYPCTHCFEDCSWPASDLWWSEKEQGWVCGQCWWERSFGEEWDEQHPNGEPFGISLEKEIERQKNLPMAELPNVHVNVNQPEAVNKDTQRMDWLERNLRHISHDRTTCSVDMSGRCVRGQLENEARGSNAGPSYFQVNHRSIREAIDDAMQWPLSEEKSEI